MKNTPLLWWNVANLFDDVDDPHTNDIVRSQREYHRDLAEIVEVVASIDPCPALVGMAEVEHRGVVDDLCAELRWHPARREYHWLSILKVVDPRGIDVAMMHQPQVKIDRVEACHPNDAAAVRPVVLIHARYQQQRLQLALVHSKSRRSGPSHPDDDRPGSRIRFALRSFAAAACHYSRSGPSAINRHG